MSASASVDLDAVYAALRATMVEHVGSHIVATDDPGLLSIENSEPDAKGKRAWRGGVQIKKNYVSYHLMAIYEDPSMLENISAPLRARMQGKSCFNFKAVDDALFDELGTLTRAAMARPAAVPRRVSGS